MGIRLGGENATQIRGVCLIDIKLHLMQGGLFERTLRAEGQGFWQGALSPVVGPGRRQSATAVWGVQALGFSTTED